MKSWIATVVLVLAFPCTAVADVGRWTSGYGQGINEATIENALGVKLYISCPDAVLNRSPSVTLEIPDLRGGVSDDTIGTLVMVDNRSTSLTFERKVLDQKQVIFDWRADTPAEKRELGRLIGQLERGIMVTVAMPSQSLREAFTLAGSREALRGCRD